eukprot:CAMPEP_0182426132 /NCGR_PEP_ID=MMETSP1167-20130531/12609_1 /TAXON_ID=2988 /ORGANISM="Mallomonas Sp, Strain CCMP3275" /LENGTH=528 /DNA_ID=CAMNT_0024607345 /DNA_START=271 /DNA_END=1857 /DNA_ORIENTATION=-
MGDWGAQTSMNKRRELSETGNEENVEFLSSKAYQKSNNKNSNEKSYWSVLVAKAMGDYADENPIDFLLALGDNFYNNGVQSTSDSLWTTVYSNVYYYDSLQVPWYALFGNHDYGTEKSLGNLQAQIDYSDGRWHAGYCYKQTFTVPNSQVTIDVVFVDSTLIAPEETYATSSEAGISEDTQASKTQEQLSCMEEYLQSSTASYLIVAGHYPMFSTGKNGPGDSTTMVEAMLPYLEKYEVDAYLCGHDHRLEHLQYTTSSGGTMDFIISGAAGKPDSQLSTGITSSAESMFSAATGGFAVADVNGNGMKISIVDYTGEVLYTMYRPITRETADTSVQSDRADSSENSWTMETFFSYSSMIGIDQQELVELGVLLGFFLSLLGAMFLATAPPRSIIEGDGEGERENEAGRIVRTTTGISALTTLDYTVREMKRRFAGERKKKLRAMTVGEAVREIQETHLQNNVTTKIPQHQYIPATMPKATMPVVVPYARRFHLTMAGHTERPHHSLEAPRTPASPLNFDNRNNPMTDV